MKQSTSRMALVAAVAVAVVIAIAVTLSMSRREPHGIVGARRLLEDSGRFSPSPDAARTFARVASLLLDDGRACAPKGPACEARFSAAAYAQVFAVPALDCSQPVIHRARLDLLRYVRAIERLPRASPTALPTPAVPNC